MTSPARITIDLDALAANYARLQQQAKGVAVAGVVKANAYGCGLEPVARVLTDLNCPAFFVATCAEGQTLRAITRAPIYLLGGLHSGDMTAMRDAGLQPIINAPDDLHIWNAEARGAPCAIHFDTGMNRLGYSSLDVRTLLDDTTALRTAHITLALSHFACADEAHHPLTALQCDRFYQIRTALAPHMPDTQWSLCNSSGLFTCPDDLYDMVRPGYAMYGGNPTPDAANPMQSVVALHARIYQIRQALRGETVGYGATHRLENHATLATLGIGYADGLPRSFGTQGYVYVNGAPCPITGRISMDSMTIDITHMAANTPRVGDWVEIMGPHQGVDAVGTAAQTIGYEVLTRLGSRPHRVYTSTP